MTSCYILDEHSQPVPATYGTFHNRDAETIKAERNTRQTPLLDLSNDTTVYLSTLFLGSPCGWRDGHPLLWETLLLRNPAMEDFSPPSHNQRLYTSLNDAYDGHERVLKFYLATQQYLRASEPEEVLSGDMRRLLRGQNAIIETLKNDAALLRQTIEELESRNGNLEGMCRAQQKELEEKASLIRLLKDLNGTDQRLRVIRMKVEK